MLRKIKLGFIYNSSSALQCHHCTFACSYLLSSYVEKIDGIGKGKRPWRLTTEIQRSVNYYPFPIKPKGFI